ncbi:MAG: rod shape-determining protein MreC [Cardiobacteriaceae bacterium]|nr:rod shape-determining protein MreC [Cardiobacteriaceae bacterium]
MRYQGQEQVEKAQASRLPTLGIVGVLSCLLLIVQAMGYSLSMMRHVVYDYFYQPIRTIVYMPVQSIVEFRQSAVDKELMREEWLRLRQENHELRAQLQRLSYYRAENSRLRRMMDSILEVTEPVLIAELSDSAIDSFQEEVTINRGSLHGVFVNQAVIDAQGLVGQVVEVFDREARVMLISDARSRVPVYVERTQRRAIISGSAQAQSALEINDWRVDHDIEVGDVLMSSGLGGVFPRGYPVAEVVSVERDQRRSFVTIHLKPIAKLDSMLEVLLLSKRFVSGEEQIMVGPEPFRDSLEQQARENR